MSTDIMNIYAPAGSKVVFAYPKNGYPCDGERAKEYGLEVGCHYTVLRTHVGRSSSTVELAECPTGIRFNTVLFADAANPITDTDRLDWLERNLMHLSHARGTSSVYMDGKAVSGQLVNEAREIYTRDLETYAECVETGVWPGYAPGFQELKWPMEWSKE